MKAPVAAVRAAKAAARSPSLDLERRLWREGYRWVAGIDEVGRGAWAGPLSVAVAVVHAGTPARSLPRWLMDSKLLAEDRRERAFDEVTRWCADAAVGHASAEECDRFGMTRAWRLAAHRALGALELVPDAVVIDGPFNLLRPSRVPSDAPDADGRPAGGPGDGFVVPAAPVPSTVLTMVDGDARCAGVAAASVLAKVVRDRMMREEAVHFPPYGFDSNKGYPSSRHQIALRGYGLSAIHRRTWSYVADLPWGRAGA
jgi:ribonuclease HII